MRRFALVTSLLLAAAPATATDYNAAMQAYLDSGELAWLSDAALLDAVRAQNAVTGSLTEAEIIALDDAWRAQVGTADTPLVHSVLDGATADFLRAQVAASGGIITEIILMDAAGLNVAVSHVTSDYWQGDEAKHQDTYGVGPDAVHFSEIELDESSQRYQGQISVTLVDPETGEAIGAVTIGVDAQALS
jgi:hypothetical protein